MPCNNGGTFCEVAGRTEAELAAERGLLVSQGGIPHQKSGLLTQHLQNNQGFTLLELVLATCIMGLSPVCGDGHARQMPQRLSGQRDSDLGPHAGKNAGD